MPLCRRLTLIDLRANRVDPSSSARRLPFAAAVVTWFAPVTTRRKNFTIGRRCGDIRHGASAAAEGRTGNHYGGGSASSRRIVHGVSACRGVSLRHDLRSSLRDISPSATVPAHSRYGRRFYAGFNLFCWSLIVVPLVNGLALLWVAIEITTVISALLVAIDDTEGASEAAWKYVLLASLGLGIALFATIMMYYAGTAVFGASYSLSYTTLLSGAPHFHPDIVRFAFVLAVLGYGTKMGLFPVHTWLPDAHSEAPTPVSALLSGALLAVSFYAILRFFQIAEFGHSDPRFRGTSCSSSVWRHCSRSRCIC